MPAIDFLSIILPYKNAAYFLESMWGSLQTQDFENWELIAVNDHSEDDSVSVLQNAVNQDERVLFLENDGEGIIDALQTGYAHCRGHYITRMDADDLMPPGRLSILMQAMENSPAGTVVTGLVKYFAEEPVSKGYRQYERWLNYVNEHGLHREMMYRECTIASPNWVIRKSDLERCGAFYNLEYPEDYDLVLRWYYAGFQFRVVPEITLWWREHPARTSRTSRNYKQEAFFRLKIRRFLQWEDAKGTLALLGTGRKGKITARILEKQQRDFRWLALMPELYPNGIRGKRILALRDLPQFSDVQVLIAVYPNAEERQTIRDFMEQNGLEEGVGYWFL